MTGKCAQNVVSIVGCGVHHGPESDAALAQVLQDWAEAHVELKVRDFQP